jgi:spore coat protein CotH
MRPHILLLLLAALWQCRPATAQALYDLSTVQTIKIEFFQSNWDAKLDSLKNIDNGDYLLAKSVEINGQLFDSVGVKYKGNSSYKASNAKNPLHVKLNYVKKGQDYQGYKDIKLSNGFSDPTFIREVLSYDIIRKYTDAPRANHAKVWINGEYFGVYGNVESINKRFLKEHFFTDGDNPFFKCNPEDFSGPGTGGNFPDLVYSSADSTFYYNKYDIQSDIGWYELLQLMDTLKNKPDAAASVLDVDRALWMLAFNSVTVNLDSYTGAFAQNYYLYHDKNERWLPISWDLNMSYGAFPLLAQSPTGTLSLTQMKQMDPLVQSSNANRPMIKALLSNADWKKRYLAHLKTILTENFANEAQYKAQALALQGNIDAAVQEDTKKFYTYNDFKNNITQGVSGGGGFGTVPGITDLMNARFTFLSAHASLTPTQPVFTDYAVEKATDVLVTLPVTNATSVWLHIRNDSDKVFKKLRLYDDGQHEDGTANDGTWGLRFSPTAANSQIYFYAENANAGAFFPARAEHEFFILNSAPLAGSVVINEFLADNVNGAVDEALEAEDWLELYNNSSTAVSLNGIYLSDEINDLNKWKFPSGTAIPPNAYLIVWLDEDETQGPFHAKFRLKATGEALYLSDGQSNVIDSVSFGAQLPDVTTGRYPNGTGPFKSLPPTFNAQNMLTISTSSPSLVDLRLYPNPTSGALYVVCSEALGLVRCFDARGSLVLSQTYTGRHAQIDTRSWPKGVYSIQVGLHGIRRVVVVD